MGAHPYYYFAKYRRGEEPLFAELRESDIERTLKDLRRQEFEAGRYNPVIRDLEFPIGPHSPSPGAHHVTINEAWLESDDEGTRSILDLDHVAEQPGFRALVPLKEEVLLEMFGTTRPTRWMVESDYNRPFSALLGKIERGMGIYIVLYNGGQADEIFFSVILVINTVRRPVIPECELGEVNTSGWRSISRVNGGPGRRSTHPTPEDTDRVQPNPSSSSRETFQE